MEANEMNPAGFFQDLEFDDLFNDLEFMPLSVPVDHPDRIKLRELIQARQSRGTDWGVKFRLTPFLLEEFPPDSKLIVTARPASVSILSLRQWLDEVDQSSTQIIMRSRNVIDLAVTGRDHLTVDFDDLIDDPVEEVRQLMTYVGVVKSIDEIAALVQPELRRYW